jgi:transcriptional regulator with XRE-family HTH domain
MTELGKVLREVRHLKSQSLKTVAEKAEISPAYLQKIELGGVRAPSPRVIYGISEALDLPYVDLMRLAGHIVPSAQDASVVDPVHSLAIAMNASGLSPEEVKALSEYLAFVRYERTRRGAS